MDSILTSIKKMLGIEETDEVFDTDIIIFINATLMTLQQIGVGPDEGFIILDKSQTWGEFLGDNKNIEAVKLYMYYKVKLGFDPPSSSFVLDAMKEQVKEIEWRLNVQVDKPLVEPTVEEEVL